MRIVRSKKGIAFVALAAAAALALAAGALAVFPNDTVIHYAGCLNTSASPGGTFVNVAVGDTPAKACSNGQVLVHLSGGDITAVGTAAGSGLTGGKDNGAASLALDSTGCSSGGLLKWNGASWLCGSDNNNTYSAGTGLDLSGSTFSVASAYQLPQSCSNEQTAKWNGTAWACSADAGSAGAWSATGGNVSIPDDENNHTITQLALPAGNWAVFANQNLDLTAGGDVGRDYCDLRVDTTLLDEENVFLDNSGSYDAKTVVEMALTNLPTSAVVNVVCRTNRDTGQAGHYVLRSGIVAIPVTSIN